MSKKEEELLWSIKSLKNNIAEITHSNIAMQEDIKEKTNIIEGKEKEYSEIKKELEHIEIEIKELQEQERIPTLEKDFINFAKNIKFDKLNINKIENILKKIKEN